MVEPGFIYWDVSPIIVKIGPFTFRWYGLLFGLAFLLGYYMVSRMFKYEGKPERYLDPLLVYMVVGTVLGARLGHVLFYNPGYYFSQPLEILKVWHGGLASHGGAIGILVALYVFVRRRPDFSYLWLLDRLAVPTALGGALIRLGNLFNSEILGTPTDVPWAFVFARVDAAPRHPAQLYESIGYFVIFLGLFAVYRRLKDQTPPGLLLGLFLTSVFSHRFAVEFVKVQQTAFAESLPLSMGQLLSLPMIVAGIALLAYSAARSWPRRQNSAAAL